MSAIITFKDYEHIGRHATVRSLVAGDVKVLHVYAVGSPIVRYFSLTVVILGMKELQGNHWNASDNVTITVPLLDEVKGTRNRAQRVKEAIAATLGTSNRVLEGEPIANATVLAALDKELQFRVNSFNTNFEREAKKLVQTSANRFKADRFIEERANVARLQKIRDEATKALTEARDALHAKSVAAMLDYLRSVNAPVDIDALADTPREVSFIDLD